MKQIENSEKSDQLVDKCIWMEFLNKNEKTEDRFPVLQHFK